MIGRVALLLGLAGFGWWAWEKRQRRTHPVPPGLRPDLTLPHEREFELHHNALSLCSMKTRVCLAELGIDYASHPIDLIETGSYQTLSRAFLRVNPAGTVPVLVHQGHPIYESHEQIRYAAAHAPPGSPSLVPDDPERRAEMERWIDRSSLTEDPIAHADRSAGNAIPGLTLPLFAAMIERIAVPKILEGLLFHFDRRRPLMFLLFKARGLEAFPGLAPLVRIHTRSREHMHCHLDALESQLEKTGGPWILGDLFTLADVSWLVIFERLAQVDLLHVLLTDARPRCREYWHALRGRPSYREAILEHPHPTIEHGRERLAKAKAANPRLRQTLETN